LAGDLTGKRVLDLCGGAGEIALECVDRGASFVSLVDKSADMTDLAEMRKSGVEVFLFDVGHYLFVSNMPKDVVFCRQAVNYWFGKKTVGDLYKSMNSGGVFIFNTFNQQPSPEPKVKKYELADEKGIVWSFVEVSWKVGFEVHHVQIREEIEPHHTTFQWIPPEYFKGILSYHFDVEVKTDGGTDIYICRKI